MSIDEGSQWVRKTSAAGGRHRGHEAPEPRTDRRKRRVELAGAIIIDLAAVLTAVAPYSGSQADSIMQAKYNQALEPTLFANDVVSNASAEQTEERDWFFTYLAEAVNGTDAADVFFDAMPGEVQDLTVEWLIDNQSRLDNLEPLDDPFTTDEDGEPILESFNQLQYTEQRQ